MNLPNCKSETTFSSAKLRYIDVHHRPAQGSLSTSKIYLFLCSAVKAPFGSASVGLSPFQVTLLDSERNNHVHVFGEDAALWSDNSQP
jgi:hypothetical protein